MSKFRRYLVGAAAVAAVGAVVWASIASGGDGKGVAVQAEATSRREVVARVKASGEINPKRKVEIQSKVIGEITALPVREGDRVAAGQVIVEIEKATYEAARDQARAALDQATVNLERARAELANAELSLERVSRLNREGISTQEALDQARLARDSAEIAVRSQQEAIRQSRSAYQRAVEDLERTTIRAPMDGHVTALNVEQGETAVMGTMNFQGSVLMVIGDLAEMVAEVEVAESEVVPIAVGQEAAIHLDALADTPLAGKVVEIGASGVKQGDVVRFRVKIGLSEPDPRVKPGMTARVEITTERAAGVLAVPQQAVQTRWLDAAGKEVERREGDRSQREISAVFVRDGAKATRKEVTTGVHDELWVEVRTGLAEGEEVITGPYRVLRKLKGGDPVRLAEKQKGDAAKAGESKENGSADRDP
jgi:HlyD family secretion protein